MSKLILTALTMLFCTSVQSSTQYPDLTHNYESIWRANIDELRNEFTNLDDYEIEWFKSAASVNKKSISFKNIKKPVLENFVKASDYLDMDVVNKFAPKADANAIIYILKDRLEKIKSVNSLSCEYKMKMSDYGGDWHYRSLNGLKDPYIEFMIGKGYETNVFVDTHNQLGITKIKNGYDSGVIRVLIKGRVVVLSLFDCYQDKGKGRIIKDLTEWAELLIEANY
jgi:hypothetical protein